MSSSEQSLWPPGTGATAELTRHTDWASTSLGPSSEWPERLKITVEMMLTSPLVSSVALTADRLLLYNDAAAHLYGTRHPGAFGCPLSKSFPESYPAVAGLYDRVFAGETVTVHEQPLAVGTSGGEEVFDAYLTPVRAADGAIIGAHMIGVEIGSRVRAEATLRVSEGMFRGLVNATSYATYRMNPDWTEMRRLDGKGFLSDRVSADSNWVQHYILQEDQPLVWAAIWEALRTKSMFELEHRVRQADGSIGWTLSRAVPLLDAAGEITEWFGAASDITARKLAEKSAHDKEEKQAFLLRLGDVLRPIADPIQVQKTAMSLLGAHLGVVRASYFVFAEDQNTFSMIAGYETTNFHFPDTMFLSDFSPEVSAAYFAGKTFVAHDTEIDPALASHRDAYRAVGTRAWIGVPLVKQGRLLVALGVVSATPREWTSLEVELVEEVAERTWAAVERARIEMELRTSEEKYRTLFEVMDQGYEEIELMRDAEGRPNDYRIILANPAYESIVGIPVETMLGRSVREVIPGIDPWWFTTFGRLAETGVSERFEREEPEVDRWFDLHVVPRNRNRLLVLFDNITERKRAEEALHKSEERQAFLLQLSDALRPLSVPDEITGTATRLLGEWLHASRVYYAMWPPGEDFGEVARDYAAPGVEGSLAGRYPTATFGSAFKRLSKGNTWVVHDAHSDSEMDATERQYYLDHGVIAWVDVPLVKREVTVAALCVVQNGPRRWSAEEISLSEEVAERTWAAVERSRAEAALREGEERFRLFVENVREYALIQTNSQGEITSWNPGAQRLFGYSSDVVLGRSFDVLLTAEDLEEGVFTRELKFVAGGLRNEDARYMLRQDRTRFWARWITEPIYDTAGEFRGLAKVMRDETERQRADQALRTSLVEKEELLKEVHHRVKNNLQVIVSLLNMQSRQIGEGAIVAPFEEARNRVLAISAIHELLYRAESIAGIVLADYARQLAPGLVRFYGLDSRVKLKIAGDGNKLELERAVPFGMLLNELVSNACKHAFPALRTGTLLLSIDREDGDLELTVADDGQGLPDDFHPEKTSSLGLKLVHALARQLRGTVQFSSFQGTTIKVRFPASGTEESDEQ